MSRVSRVLLLLVLCGLAPLLATPGRAAPGRATTAARSLPVEMVLHSADQGESTDLAAAGRWMVTGSYGLTRVWRDGALRRVLPGSSPVLTDGGETVVTVGDAVDNRSGIRLWSSATGELLEHLAPETLFSGVVVTRDGSKVVGQVLFSDQIRIFDRRRDTLLIDQGIPTPGSVSVLDPQLYEEADLVVARGKKGLRLFSLSRGEERCFLAIEKSFGQPFAASLSGQRLAAPLNEGEVGIWETETCRRLSTLQGFGAAVRRLALDPRGKQLATSEDGGLVRIWDLETGKERHQWATSGFLMALAFSPSGDRLVLTDPSTGTAVYDTETGVVKLAAEALPVVGEARFTADGQRIFGEVGAQPILLDATTGRAVLWPRAGRNQVDELGWSADGRRLAIRQGNDVRVFDLPAGFAARFIGRAFSFAPDDHLVVGPVEGRVQIWDLERRVLTGELVEEAPIAKFSVDSRSGKIATLDKGGRVALWAISGKRTLRFAAGKGELLDLSIVAEGRRIIGRGKDGRLWSWSSRDGSLAGLVEPDSPGKVSRGLEVSTDGLLAAAVDRNGALTVWGLDPLRHRFSPSMKRERVENLAFLGGATTLAMSTLGKPDVQLFDLTSGQLQASLPGHLGGVRALAADPTTGSWLAAGAMDRTLRIWEARSGRLLLHGEAHPSVPRALAWSPDGQLLASGDHDGEIRLWGRDPARLVGRLLVPKKGRWVFVASDGRWDVGRRGSTSGVNAWRGADRLEWESLEPGRSQGLLPESLGWGDDAAGADQLNDDSR